MASSQRFAHAWRKGQRVGWCVMRPRLVVASRAGMAMIVRSMLEVRAVEVPPATAVAWERVKALTEHANRAE